MPKLWGGRFENKTDREAFYFNESLSFDSRLFEEDIEGSLAHAEMLKSRNIISEEDADKIIDGLKGILKDIRDGSLTLSDDYEDIHSFVEANLTDRIGDVSRLPGEMRLIAHMVLVKPRDDGVTILGNHPV